MKTLSRKFIVCLAWAVGLACCQPGAAQTFNTSGDLLVQAQPVLVNSPQITVYTNALVLVTTNRQVLGTISSYAANNSYIVQYAVAPAPPNSPTFQISTNGGDTWGSFKTGSNALVSVYGQSSFYLTNLNVRGYSLKYNTTSYFSGQRLLVDNPVLEAEVSNKRYVDQVADANRPYDWASYPATNDVTIGGNDVFWNTHFSTTTESATNVTQTFRVYGTPLLRFEASSTASGSNITSQIAVTTNTVTISVATNGVTTRPIVYTTPDFIAGNWQLLSQVTTITESYPTAVGAYYTITFDRLAGDNYFTVYLASGESFQRIKTLAPLRIEAGLFFKTNYVVADFVPVPGFITFAASNNALYSVSTTKTNLIVTP